jgi:hypothetical protein
LGKWCARVTGVRTIGLLRLLQWHAGSLGNVRDVECLEFKGNRMNPHLSTSLPKLIPSIKREVEFGFASADCTKSSSLLMSETYKQALTKEVNVLVFRASVSLFIRCLQTEFL